MYTKTWNGEISTCTTTTRAKLREETIMHAPHFLLGWESNSWLVAWDAGALTRLLSFLMHRWKATVSCLIKQSTSRLYPEASCIWLQKVVHTWHGVCDYPWITITTNVIRLLIGCLLLTEYSSVQRWLIAHVVWSRPISERRNCVVPLNYVIKWSTSENRKSRVLGMTKCFRAA